MNNSQAGRALRGLVAIVALSAVASSLHAQAMPTPQQLAARHDSLIGGRAVLEKRTSMKLTGAFTLAAAGIEAPLEILKRKPNQYLFRATLGPMGEVLQGFDGTTAWAIPPGQGPVILTGDQGRQIAEQADFFADLHDFSRFSSSETVREMDFEGKRAWEVKMVRTSGGTVTEYYEIATGLSMGGITTVEGPAGPVQNTSIYTDYKDFEGFRIATRIVQRNPQFEVVLTIVSIEFDKVDAAAVALPEAVRALVPPPAKPMLDAEMAEHFKGIELTDEQVKQLVEIKARHHAAMDNLKKEAKDPNDAALKAALQQHMAAEHADFKKLLTPAQAARFEANMKGHH